jgi:ABC-type bacteriocin/lantibiotic exporter with double-glycine peptidase domain
MVKAIRQDDASDCGAVCLASICSHYKIETPLARVRQYAGTSQAGTTVAGIMSAADQLGLSARAVRLGVEELRDADMPAIAHVALENGFHHYLVVVEAGPEGLKVMDPREGRIRQQPIAEFARTWTGILILVAGAPTTAPATRQRQPLIRLLLLLKPYWYSAAGALAASTVISLLAMSMSLYVQRVVDATTSSSPSGPVGILAQLMIVILFARVGLTAGQTVWASFVGYKIDLDLTADYYRHLFALPQSFFDTMRIGEVLSRNDDAVKVREFFSGTAAAMLIGTGTLFGALLAICFVNFTLGALSAVVIALYLLVLAVSTAATKRRKLRILEQVATYDARLVESLSLIATIKRFCLEEFVSADQRFQFGKLLKLSFRLDLYSSAASSVATVIVEGFVILMLWIGTNIVLGGAMSPGKLMLCYTLIGFITSSAQAVLRGTFALQDASIAARRMFDWLDLQVEPDKGLIPLDDAPCSSVRFDRVAFRYPGRKLLFDGITFEVERGSLAVITAPSGGGKTSLLALLLRLYYPTAGTIQIGGEDIRAFTLRSLRGHVVALSQKVELFSRTIAANIAPGQAEPNLSRIEEICEILGLDEFLRSLPNGLSTQLEEAGGNLSGGQRQRLALARVLYADAPVILLDEPTAFLDAAAEMNVIKAINDERKRGKMLIVVSHAAAIIEAADQVISIGVGAACSSDLRGDSALSTKNR